MNNQNLFNFYSFIFPTLQTYEDDLFVYMFLEYCIHGDTPVTLASGISMKIKDLERAGLPEVLSLGANKSFVPMKPDMLLPKGRRECLELLFDNGQKLVCTPDHKILVRDGSWCEARTLVAGKSQVVFGINAPLYDPTEDEAAHLSAFELVLPQLSEDQTLHSVRICIHHSSNIDLTLLSRIP